jgi:hypothetical protein
MITRLLCLALLLGGCVPAQITAPAYDVDAAGFVVAGDFYHSPAFSFRIPEGWRLVAGETQADAQTVTLVSPDDCQIITLSNEPLDPPPPASSCAAGEIRFAMRAVDGIMLAASAPVAAWGDMTTTLDRLAASLLD